MLLTGTGPLAESAAGRVRADQVADADAHFARVGQTLGRALADVAVGAARAEEALAAGHIRDTVGSVGPVVTDLSGGALDVGAGLAVGQALGASGAILALLVGLALAALVFTILANCGQEAGKIIVDGP